MCLFAGLLLPQCKCSVERLNWDMCYGLEAEYFFRKIFFLIGYTTTLGLNCKVLTGKIFHSWATIFKIKKTFLIVTTKVGPTFKWCSHKQSFSCTFLPLFPSYTLYKYSYRFFASSCQAQTDMVSRTQMLMAHVIPEFYYSTSSRSIWNYLKVRRRIMYKHAQVMDSSPFNLL